MGAFFLVFTFYYANLIQCVVNDSAGFKLENKPRQ